MWHDRRTDELLEAGYAPETAYDIADAEQQVRAAIARDRAPKAVALHLELQPVQRGDGWLFRLVQPVPTAVRPLLATVPGLLID